MGFLRGIVCTTNTTRTCIFLGYLTRKKLGSGQKQQARVQGNEKGWCSQEKTLKNITSFISSSVVNQCWIVGGPNSGNKSTHTGHNVLHQRFCLIILLAPNPGHTGWLSFDAWLDSKRFLRLRWLDFINIPPLPFSVLLQPIHPRLLNRRVPPMFLI